MGEDSATRAGNVMRAVISMSAVSDPTTREIVPNTFVTNAGVRRGKRACDDTQPDQLVPGLASSPHVAAPQPPQR
ncbi:hypothetical protein FHR84_000876 [Actinopolyspora biskrensis]|uniref:Uncharacterized protein n=1 Tax=Actinopolyspora biskrensis TaxID=1470178 RepID=A0A852YV02_9ACTN|nr:hypothetical protein [Actinopolyspora biskrensis]